MRVVVLFAAGLAALGEAEAAGGGAQGLGKAAGLQAGAKVQGAVQGAPLQGQAQAQGTQYVQQMPAGQVQGQQFVQPMQPAQGTQYAQPVQGQQFAQPVQGQQYMQPMQMQPVQGQQYVQQQQQPVQGQQFVQGQQPVLQQPVQPQPQPVQQQRMPAANNRMRGPARAKPCNNKPCLNGATCTNVRSKSGNPYTCVCKKGWEGDQCQTEQTSLHLDVDLMYKAEGGDKVRQSAVVDGKVQAGFDAPDLGYAVSSEKVIVTLANKGELPLDFKQPILVPEHPEIVSPALIGGARKGGRLGRGDDSEAAKNEKANGKDKKKSLSPTKALSITHNCLHPGKSSKVQLILQFQSGNVTFGWTVTCPKVASDGLTIVMKGMEEKVYEKGVVNKWFSPTADTPYSAQGSQNVTSFILFACDPKQAVGKGKGKKKGCPKPISMNRPTVKSDYTAAASPVIIGQGAKGGTVDLATEVAVKHNCHGVGDAGITLTLNFKGYEPIVLSWSVSCYGGRAKGLTMTLGSGKDASEVVTDGVAVPAWAPDSSGQTTIGGDTRFTVFRVFSKNKDKKMTFEQAQVRTSDNDICNPGLSGQYWKGGSIGSKGGVNRFIKNKLTKTGIKKVVEQMTGHAYGKEFIKDKEKKKMAKKAAEKVSGTGKDRRLSQVDSHARMWGEVAGNDDFAIVVEQEGVTSGLPYSDRRRAAQSIIGGGNNDDMADLAASESIVVTYNCVAKGSSIITLTIPFVMYDPIDLQWTKICEGGPREFFTVRNNEKLVVEDGAPLDHWNPVYAEENGVIIDAGDTETTFQIQMAEDPKAVQDTMPMEESYLDEYVDFFVEDTYHNTHSAILHATRMVQTYGRPRIQSDKKGICRPSLSGSARKGGMATTLPQDLTVKFNCLSQGESIITVTIPVGIYLDVVFSFTKRCNRDPAKGFMMVPKGSTTRVVTNGRAEKMYQAEAVGGYVDISGMAQYAKQNKTAAFVASMSRSAGGITYLAPYARSDPPICEPRFDGDMAKGGVLTPVRARALSTLPSHPPASGFQLPSDCRCLADTPPSTNYWMRLSCT
eukprot:COSAG02_NODE_827_length_16704_cov_8.649322_2_plen_1056_part_00